MEYSKDGLHLTEGFEGCKLVAYPDPATGGIPWTIGYGHTRGVVKGMSCTQEQAEAWLLEDLKFVADKLNADLDEARVTVSQGEFDALSDFGFNLGMHALEGSTLFRKLLAGDHAGAAAEFPKWDKAGGREMAGLLRRRLAEQKEFTA